MTPVPAVLGVDLAWGPRGRTGVAVLDAGGHLLASDTLRTDDELASFTAGWAARLAVVAVDAPLVVPNVVGRRACESSVAADFGRFHAGPYPSNRSLPHMDPPRGAVLADRLGWVLDPEAPALPGRPVCLEVFPHPAMISLFGLTRVLPYKARARRPFTVRHEAMTALVGLVEEHLGGVLGLDAGPSWPRLREGVAGARRPAHLDAVEDEIDAVICAHVAWRWLREPSQLRVHGDAASGYIVTFPA